MHFKCGPGEEIKWTDRITNGKSFSGREKKDYF